MLPKTIRRGLAARACRGLAPAVPARCARSSSPTCTSGRGPSADVLRRDRPSLASLLRAAGRRRPARPARRHARAAPRPGARGARRAPRRCCAAVGEALGPSGEVVLVPGQPRPRARRGRGSTRRRRDGARHAARRSTSELDWRAEEPFAADRAAARAGDGPASPTRASGCATTSTRRTATTSTRTSTMPTFERLAAGVMAPDRRAPAPRAAATPDDYEARARAALRAGSTPIAQHARPSAAAASARPPPPRASGARSPARRRRARGRAARCAPRGVVPARRRARSTAPGSGPLQADISSAELRRAGLRGASASVLAHLGVEAAHVIFGHTHRAGPLRARRPRASGARPAARGCATPATGSSSGHFIGRGTGDATPTGRARAIRDRRRRATAAAGALLGEAPPPARAHGRAPGVKHVA